MVVNEAILLIIASFRELSGAPFGAASAFQAVGMEESLFGAPALIRLKLHVAYGRTKFAISSRAEGSWVAMRGKTVSVPYSVSF